jgi:hypothetical protein
MDCKGRAQRNCQVLGVVVLLWVAIGSYMTAQSAGAAHDFDFLLGSWKVHHRYLLQRLQGSNKWIEFEGRSEMQPLLHGAANLDRYWFTRQGREIEGFALRQFNPHTEEWTIYWADTQLPGVLQPPVRGKFHGDTGEFVGADEFNGQPILCRFIWRRKAGQPLQWEQAFSADRGKTWEINWVMTFTPASATPSAPRQ